MFKLLSIPLVVFAATVFAAPVQPDAEIQCKPVGKPGLLMGTSLRGDASPMQFTVSDEKYMGHPKIRATNDTSYQFQFYQCEPPQGMNLSSSANESVYGQLRSVKHNDQCVTSGNVWMNNSPESSGKQGKYEQWPTADGTVTLQPCWRSLKYSFDERWLRFQWFSLFHPDDNCKTLSLDAFATDVDLDGIQEENDSVSFFPRDRDLNKQAIRLITGTKKGSPAHVCDSSM